MMTEERTPLESYVFRYDKFDREQIFKNMRKPLIKRFTVFIICLIFLILLAAFADDGFIALGVIIGFCVAGIIGDIKAFAQYRKNWNSAEIRTIESTYCYDVYDNYYISTVSRNGEIKKKHKVYFTDVDSCYVYGDYLLLAVEGQSHIIKRNELVQNSKLMTLGYNCGISPAKNTQNRPTGWVKAVSVALILLSVASIFFSLALVAVLNGINKMTVENMWAFFVFLPIPLASIAFCIVLKKKGAGYAVNLIIGIIMACVLILYGSFSLIFSNVYTHGNERLELAEITLGMDLPEPARINTMDWTTGIQSSARGYIYYTSDIYVKKDAANEFEKSLAGDERWITEIPSDLIGVTSYYVEVSGGCYYVIYNADAREFNKLPDQSGSYRFLNLIYDAENGLMKLVEYQIEYTK